MGFLDRVLGRKARPPAKKKQGDSSGRFGRFLVETGMITEEQLAEATQTSVSREGRFGTICFELGYLDLATLCSALADFHQTGAITLAQFWNLSSETAHRLSEKTSTQLQVVALGDHVGRMQVAMADPKDEKAVNEIVLEIRQAVQPMAAPELLIQYALREHFGYDQIPKRIVTMLEELKADPDSGGGKQIHEAREPADVRKVLDRYGLEVPEESVVIDLSEPEGGTAEPEAVAPVDQVSKQDTAPSSADTLAVPPSDPVSQQTTDPSDEDDFAMPETVAPMSSDMLLKLAKAALLARQMFVDEAAKAYEEILAEDPENVRARNALADLKRQKEGGNAVNLDTAVTEGSAEQIDAALRRQVVMDSPAEVEALQAARSRDELGRVLLGAAATGLEVAVLFARDADDLFVGLIGHGGGLEGKDLSTIMVPAFVETVLRVGAVSPEGFYGSSDSSHANEILFAELDRDSPQQVIVFPVLGAGNIARIVLYGDAGAEPIDEAFADRLRGLCRYAGDIIQRFIEDSP